MTKQEIMNTIHNEISKQIKLNEFKTADVLINLAKEINSKIWK